MKQQVKSGLDATASCSYLMCVFTVPAAAPAPPEPTRLHSPKQSTTEHFTKGRTRGFAQRLGQWTGSRGTAQVTSTGANRAITATAELQLVQRLSSLPSGECFIVPCLTNASEASAFPYQAVRIPFDEMRRHRVTNPPRGCCWGASKSPVPQVCIGR